MTLLALPIEHFDSAAWLEAGLVWCLVHPTRLIRSRFGGVPCEPCRIIARAIPKVAAS